MPASHLHARLVPVLGAAAAALAFAVPAYAGAGDLDPGFGTGGIVLSNLDPVKGSAIEDVAVQPDGKVLALVHGYSNTNQLLRYLPDGTPDQSFDGDGIAPIPNAMVIKHVLVQPDGKILVSGAMAGDFAVARYLPTGELDTGFDGDSGTANGLVQTDLTQKLDGATGLALDSAGRIVLAGRAAVTQTGSYVGLTRYLSDGRLDQSFSGGRVVISSPVQASAWAVATQSDGKIVLAGEWGSYPNTDTMVLRLRENGFPDAFGDAEGRKVLDLGGPDQATAIAVQPTGNLVVGVDTGAEDTLIRLSPSGQPDGSFGAGGKVPLGHQISDIALASDDKLVLSGSGKLDGVDTALVERRSSNGAADPTFAGGAPAFQPIAAGEPAYWTGVALAPNGAIVLGGTTGNYPATRGAIAKVRASDDPAAPAPGAPSAGSTGVAPLTLSRVRLTSRTFVIGRSVTSPVGRAQAARRPRRGTAFVFRLNRAATVTIRIQRLTRAGRLRRGARVMRLTRAGLAGGNRVRFSGRVARRALRPGRYRAVVTAKDQVGSRSNRQTVSFTVLAG